MESALTRLGRLCRIVGLGLMVGAVLHGSAEAQRPDSTKAQLDSARARARRAAARARADTVRARPDTIRAGADTSRLRRDSLRSPADTLRPRRDTLRAPGDTLRQRRDTLRAPGDTLRARRDSLAADSARADSVMKEDLRLIAQQKKRADTVKTPTPASEMPVLTEADGALRWDRDALFASGALTLADLLERVPGLTTFRSGWIGSPQLAAFAGDFSRIRVFYDGLELDALDPRNGGILDLSYVQIWPLEEVRIERGASEVRIHLRSWRVRAVTPSTRIDMGTGDLETNAYRGYFGRRFGHGEVLQLAGAQLSSRDNRAGGDADQLSLFGRFGWAKGRFGADASFLRTHKDRSTQFREESIERDSLRGLDATNTEAYVRGSFSDTASGIWAQLMAASLSHEQVLPRLSSTDTTSTDTTIIRSQYVAAAGWSRRALSVSLTARVRDIQGVKKFAPAVRAAYDTPRLALALFGEMQDTVKLRRLELSGRYYPLGFVTVGGAVSQFSPSGANPAPSSLAFRAEVGLRVHRAWLTVGLMTRDSALLIPPITFDTGFRASNGPSLKGLFVAMRGKVWKDVGLDISAIKWDSGGAYLPQYQARSQVYIDADMRRRFPSGNLNILAAITHEYRTAVYFPVENQTLLQSAQYRSIGFLLEIRLLQATVSYQFRNLLNAQYTQVPGFPMPRPVQFYGVRWQFFN